MSVYYWLQNQVVVSSWIEGGYWSGHVEGWVWIPEWIGGFSGYYSATIV